MTTLVGLPSLIVRADRQVSSAVFADAGFTSQSTFGQNLSHHVQASSLFKSSLLVGLIAHRGWLSSHSVRRIGRNEGASRRGEGINPAGLISLRVLVVALRGRCPLIFLCLNLFERAEFSNTFWRVDTSAHTFGASEGA